MICIPVYEDTSQTLNFMAKDFLKKNKSQFHKKR